MYGLAVALDCLVFYALFLRVDRDDRTRDATATPDLWARSIDYYTNEMPASGVKTVAGKGSSRSGLRPVRHLNVTSAAQD